jgi:hypothetical protein
MVTAAVPGDEPAITREAASSRLIDGFMVGEIQKATQCDPLIA